MVEHLAEGVILVALMVFIHGVGTLVVVRLLTWYQPYWERYGGILVNTLSLTWVVGTLLFLHLLEVGVWAVYYRLRGLVPDLETGAYFSLSTYATVGYGDVLLPKEWRVIGASEALVGILMTAWSTALLIGVVNSLYAKTMETWKSKEREAPGVE